MSNSSKNFSKYTFIFALLLLSFILFSSTVQCFPEVTIVNKTDENYTDACLETTGKLCEWCCIDLAVTCSRDIRACDPLQDIKMIYIY